MFGKDQVCAACKKWQRDGGDGICRSSAPKPKIVESGKSYTVVWARMNAQDWCPEWDAYQSDDVVQ